MRPGPLTRILIKILIIVIVIIVIRSMVGIMGMWGIEVDRRSIGLYRKERDR